MEPPKLFFWFDSPFTALMAATLLAAPYDFLRQQMVAAALKIKREKELIDATREELHRQSGIVDWVALSIAAGAPFLDGLMSPPGKPTAPRVKSVQEAVMIARLSLYDDIQAALVRFDESNVLQRAEGSLRKVQSGQAQWSLINPMVQSAFNIRYSYSTMAMDQAAAIRRPAASVLPPAWEISRNAGLWWPFAGAAILSDFPAELKLDANAQPHAEDGPTVVYADGNKLWAWHGHAMREDWIMKPDTISATLLKQFTPDFRAYAAARGAGAKSQRKIKPSTLFKEEIPMDAAVREALLRQHAGGKLSLLDRYKAGEYDKVWHELIALGPAARQDPQCADVLAVVYETMHRVEKNVHVIMTRLKSLGYRFSSVPHIPPDKKTRKQMATLEKKAGPLPLSLCAFYEVVGAIDWCGEHSRLNPRNGALATDPLVVFPVDDLLQQVKSGLVANEGILAIAPDDLHKSNTSGGEPYCIEVPNEAADGRLLNERHDVQLIDYLRLVFRFGGFPGYDGATEEPADLTALREGLISF
jgi:hypothetical protein